MNTTMDFLIENSEFEKKKHKRLWTQTCFFYAYYQNVK